MRVTDGARTAAQQAALYAQGRTAPGLIVTAADGTAGTKSKHQSGTAADCCFLVAGVPTWDGPWEEYGTAAEDEGLVWGGRWKKPDRPHVELPALPKGTLRA